MVDFSSLGRYVIIRSSKKSTFFQRIRQLFCKHRNWTKTDGQEGHWQNGYEVETLHYKCSKCEIKKIEGKIIGFRKR